jgi:hypothetical protein
MAAMPGLAALVKTLRGLLKTPLRIVTEDEPDPREDEPISLRFSLDRDDVPDLIVPERWQLSASGLWRIRDVDGIPIPERVGYKPLFITQRFTDLDTDMVSLAVSWLRPSGQLAEVIAPRAQVLDARELVKLANAGAPVNSSVSSLLVRWLADLEGINSNILPSGWSSARCGWLGKKLQYYLCGAELLASGAPLHDVRLLTEGGGSQLLGYIRSSGTFEGWKATFAKIAAFPLVVVAVYAACAAPLLRILQCDNFLVDWAGRSGRGKTTALRLGMSCFGVPEEGNGLIRSWSATATGAERVAVALSDLPMALDDSAKIPDKDKPKVAATLYMIANGSGKVRGTRTGLDHVASWKTVCLSTSEASITSFTQDEGVQARVVSLHGHPLGDHGGPLAEEVRHDLALHYGHAGPRVVRWLLDHRDRWPGIQDLHRERIAYWRQTAQNEMAGRVAKYIAAMEIASQILHAELGVPAAACDVFADLWGRTNAMTTEADKGASAFASIYAWAVANRAAFWSPYGAPRAPVTGWLGRWDRIAEECDDPERANYSDDPHYLYVLPDALKGRLLALGYQPQAIIAEWSERGWLRKPSKGRTWRATIAGSPRQLEVYGLSLEALAPPSTD